MSAVASRSLPATYEPDSPPEPPGHRLRPVLSGGAMDTVMPYARTLAAGASSGASGGSAGNPMVVAVPRVGSFLGLEYWSE